MMARKLAVTRFSAVAALHCNYVTRACFYAVVKRCNTDNGGPHWCRAYLLKLCSSLKEATLSDIAVCKRVQRLLT